MILTHGANSIERGDFVEIGGRKYPVVKIGNQLWMAENLDYKFAGLDLSTNIVGNSSTPNAVYYNNDESTYGLTGKRFGLLYNQAAKDMLNNMILPQEVPGWRVPTIQDIDDLQAFIDDSDNDGYVLCKPVDYVSGWTGNDTYGFNGIPSSQRYQDLYYPDMDSPFYQLDNMSFLLAEERYYFGRSIDWSTPNKIERGRTQSKPLYSIRLVKDVT